MSDGGEYEDSFEASESSSLDDLGLAAGVVAGGGGSGGASVTSAPFSVPQAKPGGGGNREVDDAIAKVLEGGMWKEQSDPTTGKKYYYHIVTRKTTWDLHAELGLKKSVTPGGGGGGSNLGDSLTSVEGYGSGSDASGGVPMLSLPPFGFGGKSPQPTLLNPERNEAQSSRTDDQTGDNGSRASMGGGFAPWATGTGSFSGRTAESNTPRDTETAGDGDDSTPAPKTATPVALPQRTEGESPKVGPGKTAEVRNLTPRDNMRDSEAPNNSLNTTAPPEKVLATSASKAFAHDDTDSSDFSTASQLVKEVKSEQTKNKELEIAKAREEVLAEQGLSAAASPAGNLAGFTAFPTAAAANNLATTNTTTATAASVFAPPGAGTAGASTRHGVSSMSPVSVSPVNPLMMTQGSAYLATTGGATHGGSQLGGGLSGTPNPVASTLMQAPHLHQQQQLAPGSASLTPVLQQQQQQQAAGVGMQPGTQVQQQQLQPPHVVTQYVDPNQVALNQLTAGAEALGHLVRAYKDLKQPPQTATVLPDGSFAPESHDGNRAVPRPHHNGPHHEHFGVRDGENAGGTRRDGGGFSVRSKEQRAAEAQGAIFKSKRQEALVNLQEKETLLEEDLLDVVMSMLLQKQGGPLPGTITQGGKAGAAAGGKKKKVSVKFTKKVGGEEDVTQLRDKWREYTKVPVAGASSVGGVRGQSATPSLSSMTTGHVGVTGFEELTQTFSEPGSLQRLMEENTDKYITSAVKTKRIHPSVARMVLLDCVTALTDVLSYTTTVAASNSKKKGGSSKNNHSSVGFERFSPVVDPNFMVFLCVDGTRCTQRVVDFATRLLNCLPTEPVSALETTAAAATGSSKKPKILYRLEHWVTQQHWLEIHRALLTTLREVEGVVFDLDAMSSLTYRTNTRNGGSAVPPVTTEMDEADLTSCLSSTITLFCPSVGPDHHKAGTKNDKGNTTASGKKSSLGGDEARGPTSAASEAAAEQLLFQSKKLVSEFIEAENVTSTQGVTVAEEVVHDTLLELLEEPSIQEAIMRRARAKYQTKVIPKTLKERSEKNQTQTLEKDVEQQVQRVLDRIRYEVEHTDDY